MSGEIPSLSASWCQYLQNEKDKETNHKNPEEFVCKDDKGFLGLLSYLSVYNFSKFPIYAFKINVRGKGLLITCIREVTNGLFSFQILLPPKLGHNRIFKSINSIYSAIIK